MTVHRIKDFFMTVLQYLVLYKIYLLTIILIEGSRYETTGYLYTSAHGVRYDY
jgi:hypothetical protein